MRAVLIVNPHATATTQGRRDLISHALASEVALHVVHTRGRHHAAELAARARDRGVELVVVHGGDGTVNEAVNGMLDRGPGSDVPLLAIVPGGSTNVFARAIGVQADPIAATEQLLAALPTRRTRSVSVGRADDRYFTFTAGLGIDAEVVRRVAAIRASGKRISNSLHVRETVRQYFRSDRRRPRLEIDWAGGQTTGGVHFAFVSNVQPWTYLGRRPVITNPGCSPVTGLGLFAMTSMRLPSVLRVARQMTAAAQVPHSAALVRLDDVAGVTLRSRTPIAFQVDGDYLGDRETVTFASIAGALSVIV